MLKIEHLSKTYGEKKAVDDLSLHIRPGEIYGFIGHNGAGKTTTIKCCAGILQFEQGEIYIDGKSVKADPLGCKQQLAYIPDNPDKPRIYRIYSACTPFFFRTFHIRHPILRL